MSHGVAKMPTQCAEMPGGDILAQDKEGRCNQRAGEHAIIGDEREETSVFHCQRLESGEDRRREPAQKDREHCITQGLGPGLVDPAQGWPTPEPIIAVMLHRGVGADLRSKGHAEGLHRALTQR